jgi:hypothetical protein
LEIPAVTLFSLDLAPFRAPMLDNVFSSSSRDDRKAYHALG